MARSPAEAAAPLLDASAKTIPLDSGRHDLDVVYDTESCEDARGHAPRARGQVAHTFSSKTAACPRPVSRAGLSGQLAP